MKLIYDMFVEGKSQDQPPTAIISRIVEHGNLLKFSSADYRYKSVYKERR